MILWVLWVRWILRCQFGLLHVISTVMCWKRLHGEIQTNMYFCCAVSPKDHHTHYYCRPAAVYFYFCFVRIKNIYHTYPAPRAHSLKKFAEPQTHCPVENWNPGQSSTCTPHVSCPCRSAVPPNVLCCAVPVAKPESKNKALLYRNVSDFRRMVRAVKFSCHKLFLHAGFCSYT